MTVIIIDYCNIWICDSSLKLHPVIEITFRHWSWILTEGRPGRQAAQGEFSTQIAGMKPAYIEELKATYAKPVVRFFRGDFSHLLLWKNMRWRITKNHPDTPVDTDEFFSGPETQEDGWRQAQLGWVPGFTVQPVLWMSSWICVFLLQMVGCAKYFRQLLL